MKCTIVRVCSKILALSFIQDWRNEKMKQWLPMNMPRILYLISNSSVDFRACRVPNHHACAIFFIVCENLMDTYKYAELKDIHQNMIKSANKQTSKNSWKSMKDFCFPYWLYLYVQMILLQMPHIWPWKLKHLQVQCHWFHWHTCKKIYEKHYEWTWSSPHPSVCTLLVKQKLTYRYYN